MGLFLKIGALILAIVTGAQAGGAIGSGLVGFVFFVVALVVYSAIGGVIQLIFSAIKGASDDRRRYRSTHGKIKSY